jgi:hypothetical protein
MLIKLLLKSRAKMRIKEDFMQRHIWDTRRKQRFTPFFQKLLHERKYGISCCGLQLSIRSIYNVLSILNYNHFGTYVNSIHSSELVIRDTTDSSISASYLNILWKKQMLTANQYLGFMSNEIISSFRSSTSYVHIITCLWCLYVLTYLIR